ncbi:MAG: hypothetical protein V7776_23455, partial [Halopseudomonas aestusnigri]
MFILIKIILLSSLSIFIVSAQAEEPQAAENASSPLAKVRNTDFKLRVIDTGNGDRNDYAIEGAVMLSPKLKLKYEARYWETDITGRDTSGMESARLKGIYFLEG